MKQETALDRLSKIKDIETLMDWYCEARYTETISDIQEVLSIAKSNQSPSIDAMRFEAAKSVMQGLLSNPNIDLNEVDAEPEKFINSCSLIADALIAELQKTNQ